MTRKTAIAAVAGVLLIGGLWFYNAKPAPRLPRFPLAEGGEFRVVKICYGGPDDHHLGGAAGWRFRLWRRLPESLKRIVPYPDHGIDLLNPGEGHVALSIWWAVIDPTTHEPELGPSGDVIMTVDSGEDWNLDWPEPIDPGYRQIFVSEPPRDSRMLHFLVPVEEETVEFTIANPAYGKRP